MIALIGMIALYAQENKVSGIVLDVNNDPLIGVSILDKTTDKGTITNYDGTF